MSERPDHYGVLGVPPTATLEQVKAAYRRQALRLHPDKNLGSNEHEEAFKRCTEAFNVLSDERQREIYDVERMRDTSVPELVGGLLNDLLGNRLRRAAAGEDLRYTLELSLQEAASGVSRRISFQVAEPCAACHESGAAPGGSRPCVACKGRGFKTGGLLSLPRPCARCGGQGVNVVVACKRCSGVGTIETARSYTVKLPAGVRAGDIKVVKGQGAAGRHGGRAGDLNVVVSVQRHSLFEIDGTDLRLDLPVAFITATLGASVDVPTLGGAVRMKIPAGTQSGRTFRLRGKGLPGPERRGDQLVRVMVETPVGLEERQRRLLRQFVDACAPEMEPLQRGFEQAGAQDGKVEPDVVAD